MNNKKKFYSLALASTFLAIFLIFVSSVASAASSPTIIETKITSNTSDSEYPVIYGNKIAWQDDRNGNWDIYMQDLSTKQQIHTTNLANQVHPAIYGNNVVWEDYQNGNPNIYLQDLSTKKQTRIAIGTAYQRNPAIYGNRIVWEDYRNGPPVEGNANGNPDIYMYDISTKKETRITTSELAYNPAIYDNKIVWDDWRSGSSDIYMYDLSTKKETRITTNEARQEHPAINNNKIVWHDTRNGELEIYMYDLSNKKETRITKNSSVSLSPTIYGNRIVWEDTRNGNSDTYVYDLSTRQEIHTIGKSDKGFPTIYYDRIVWMDNRNGYYDNMDGNWHNWDIYMGTLIYPPIAAFSTSPISGKAPLTVKFTDKSTRSPTSRFWDFGDKSTSTTQNPAHKYAKAGRYTVSLTVKNAAGSNSITKSKYITVK